MSKMVTVRDKDAQAFQKIVGEVIRSGSPLTIKMGSYWSTAERRKRFYRWRASLEQEDLDALEPHRVQAQIFAPEPGDIKYRLRFSLKQTDPLERYTDAS